MRHGREFLSLWHMQQRPLTRMPQLCASNNNNNNNVFPFEFRMITCSLVDARSFSIHTPDVISEDGGNMFLRSVSTCLQNCTASGEWSCEFWCLLSGVAKVSVLLGYNATRMGNRIPKFREKAVSSSWMTDSFNNLDTYGGMILCHTHSCSFLSLHDYLY